MAPGQIVFPGLEDGGSGALDGPWLHCRKTEYRDRLCEDLLAQFFRGLIESQWLEGYQVTPEDLGLSISGPGKS